MRKEELLRELRRLKRELSKEGFIIESLCGSYARNEATETSDIDLLYHVNENFLKKFGGFVAFSKLEEIKKALELRLKREVDLIPSNNLSKTAKKYLEEECIYV
ncbi:nucleotidyltransferase family protein [Nitratifractor sp.]